MIVPTLPGPLDRALEQPMESISTDDPDRDALVRSEATTDLLGEVADGADDPQSAPLEEIAPRGHFYQVLTGQIAQQVFGCTFEKDARPAWLVDPATGVQMELDFYNAERKLAIEYFGRHHFVYPSAYHPNTLAGEAAFKAQVARDGLKAYLCVQAGITLLTVPYSVHGDDSAAEQRIREHLLGSSGEVADGEGSEDEFEHDPVVCVLDPSFHAELTGKIAERVFGFPFEKNARPDRFVDPATGRQLELDFYNAEHQVAIEINGIEHFTWPNHLHPATAEGQGDFLAQVEADKVKLELCDKLGIYLLTVPYNVGQEHSMPEKAIEDWLRARAPDAAGARDPDASSLSLLGAAVDLGDAIRHFPVVGPVLTYVEANPLISFSLVALTAGMVLFPRSPLSVFLTWHLFFSGPVWRDRSGLGTHVAFIAAFLFGDGPASLAAIALWVFHPLITGASWSCTTSDLVRRLEVAGLALILSTWTTVDLASSVATAWAIAEMALVAQWLTAPRSVPQQFEIFVDTGAKGAAVIAYGAASSLCVVSAFSYCGPWGRLVIALVAGLSAGRAAAFLPALKLSLDQCRRKIDRWSRIVDATARSLEGGWRALLNPTQLSSILSMFREQ